MDESCRDMWAAVLETAIIDYQDKKYRQSVEHFFQSDWFSEICDMLDWSPSAVLAKINEGGVNV